MKGLPADRPDNLALDHDRDAAREAMTSSSVSR